MKQLRIVLALLTVVGCSNPLTSTEEEFLGIWEAEFTEESGTPVRIVWWFESYFKGDRTVWNEIHHGDELILRRRGEWEVIDAMTLRVVLDSENVHVTDRYEETGEDGGLGEFIGSVFGAIISGLTDDEYTIKYTRDGDVLRLKWYDGDYHTYVKVNQDK